MKKSWNIAKQYLLWALLPVLLTTACRNPDAGQHRHDHDYSGHEAAQYTCPMHPEIIRDKPGSCPICKMDLVKKENQPVTHPSDSSHTPEMHGHASSAEAGVSAIGDLDMLLKPTYEYVLSTVKTLHPEQRTMPLRLDAPGYLAYDPRLLNVVSARFGGRIERLYARYPYQPVRKGQRILDIYSPEIATAQQELIFLLENDPANTVLLENARKRLSLLGLTGEQIRQVETERKPLLSLPVFSLYSGLIFDNSVSLNNTASAAPGMNENMNNTAAPAQTVPASAGPGELSLKEGMYVQAGQRLFGLQSLATVWAMLEFYPSDVSMLNTGQAVEIHVEPFERPFKSKIDYIEPLYSSGGKNLRARVYLPNPGGQLKPGALLRATVQAGSRTALWIPETASLDLGKNHVVFVKKGGVFQTRAIRTGIRTDGWIEVIAGIGTEDEIAENARFLMDSESFVK